ncbi:MAG: hypothetical protein M3169_19230 [Candidatus Eremiobacteraeota bacterium]|nr:hypothetical protein [Candidatus Eremiobacteraeota bacterium]
MFMLRLWWWLIGLVALAGCGGAAQLLGFDQSKGTCGPPPPVAAPNLFFAYPGDGATSVSTTIGELVFAGGGASGVQLSTAAGAPVATSPLQPAPLPLPSPLVTPPPQRFGPNPVYVAATVGQLAPGTTYGVTYTYQSFTGVPPDCSSNVTQQLGSFATR